MDFERLTEIIEKKLQEAEKRLREKRYKIGEADNRNESRYISATRWALENEITMAEDEVLKLKEGLSELGRLKKMIPQIKKVKIGNGIKILLGGKQKEFFITESFEDLALGMLPSKLPIALAIMERQKGEEVDFNGQKIKIEEIY